MQRNRSTLFLGVLLILIGIWLVASQQIPSLRDWLDINFSWPVWTIGAGILIFIIGLLVGAPGMAVPASIVTGIGCILYYQNANDDFASWSYMWTLIPGFVGFGTMLASVLGDGRSRLMSGFHLIIVSSALFLVFASIFGGIELLGSYGSAIILIVLGVYIIARGMIRKE